MTRKRRERGPSQEEGAKYERRDCKEARDMRTENKSGSSDYTTLMSSQKVVSWKEEFQ